MQASPVLSEVHDSGLEELSFLTPYSRYSDKCGSEKSLQLLCFCSQELVLLMVNNIQEQDHQDGSAGKGTAARSDELSSIPVRPTRREKRINLHRLSSDFYTHTTSEINEQNVTLKAIFGGWRDGSADGSICCSCKGSWVQAPESTWPLAYNSNACNPMPFL